MKRLLIAMGVVGLIGGAMFVYDASAQGGRQDVAGKYKVDPVHSSIVFNIKHLGVSFVWGRFNKFSGTIDHPDGKPSFDVTVQADSIDTAVAKRDEHLKSGDFFNVSEHPTIHFVSTGVQPGQAEGQMKLAGTMTLMGKSQPVTATLTRTGFRADKVGYEARLTIQRSAFNMAYGVREGALGDDVNLVISLQAKK